MPKPSRKQDILRAATELFASEGYNATGVDRVLKQAGASKMALYNQFGSKEALICEVLEQRRALFMDWLSNSLYARDCSPSQRLELLLQLLRNWVEHREPALGRFRGCPFMNAAAEFGGISANINAVIQGYQRDFLAQLERLAGALGVADAAGVAREMDVILRGAISLAHLRGDARVFDDARQLFAAALPVWRCRDITPSVDSTE